MSTQLVISSRYNGPARSANGGYAAGSLAAAVLAAELRPDATVEVTLRRPPPLETPMTLTWQHGGGRLEVPDGLVAEARVVDEDPAAVDPVEPDVAAAAMLRYPGLTNHPFPRCFSCGPDRDAGDGLRIFPGRVEDAIDEPGEVPRPRVAATWTPDATVAEDFHAYADGQPRVSVPVTLAALDCVGGWAGDLEERLMVLARMTARLDSLPVIGEEHVVVGMGRGRDGRKAWTSSTLYDVDGRVVGSAEHLWIAVDPATFA